MGSPGSMVWLAVAATTVLGCADASSFSCVENAQCVQGGIAGACEANGFCSFPDDACDSGRRFGGRAPDGVASVCVSPPDDATSTGTTLDDGGSSGSTAAGDELPVDPASSDGGGPSSSSTSRGEGTSSGDDAASSSDATGEPTPTCEIDVHDPFDAEDMPWTPWSFGDAEVSAMDGHAVVRIGASAVDDWHGAGLSLDPVDMAGGWARAHVSVLEDPGLDAAAGLSLETSLCEYHVRIDETGVSAVVWHDQRGADQILATVPLPELPLWLQVRMDEDGATAYFEWSSDAASWELLAQGVFPECDDGAGQLGAVIGAGGNLLDADALRHFDAFTRCVP